MRRAVLFLVFLTVLARGAWAHETRPAYLELRQTGAETYEVLWKVPGTVDNERFGISVRLPEGSVETSGVRSSYVDGSFTDRWTVRRAGGLTGGRIQVAGLSATYTDVLVRVLRLDGTAQVGRLTPALPELVVEAEPGRWQMVATYTRMGVEHILTGVDHLLFVLGLMLIVRDGWMLVKTITAFTVAHSITLALATLGVVSVPLPPLNAAIALSILFLGPEIVRVRRGATSVTIRHPWVVAMAFGLLHGLGMASGLTALGLARGDVPAALLCFNGGVEIGQLFFVAILLLLARSFSELEIRWPRWALALPCYAVGSLGAFWTIQRVWMMMGALR